MWWSLIGEGMNELEYDFILRVSNLESLCSLCWSMGWSILVRLSNPDALPTIWSRENVLIESCRFVTTCPPKLLLQMFSSTTCLWEKSMQHHIAYVHFCESSNLCCLWSGCHVWFVLYLCNAWMILLIVLIVDAMMDVDPTLEMIRYDKDLVKVKPWKTNY